MSLLFLGILTDFFKINVLTFRFCMSSNDFHLKSLSHLHCFSTYALTIVVRVEALVKQTKLCEIIFF